MGFMVFAHEAQTTISLGFSPFSSRGVSSPTNPRIGSDRRSDIHNASDLYKCVLTFVLQLPAEGSTTNIPPFDDEYHNSNEIHKNSLFKQSIPTMASSYTLLADWKARRCSRRFGRLLRF